MGQYWEEKEGEKIYVDNEMVQFSLHLTLYFLFALYESNKLFEGVR